jgi:hypothetical protein
MGVGPPSASTCPVSRPTRAEPSSKKPDVHEGIRFLRIAGGGGAADRSGEGQAGSVRSFVDVERDQMIPRGSPAMRAAAATPRIGPMAIETLSAWATIAPAYQPQ